MSRLRFSGHETFQCRNLWLKKGFDFINNQERDFNDPLAVVDLGVGKNMVDSIRFWLKSFDLIDEENEQPNELAKYLFDDNGADPFVEDLGTLWLLHYKLVSKSSKSTTVGSIYDLVFNKFRKHRIEFTKDHLKNFLIGECEEMGESHSPNTIETDIGVFLKNYVRPSGKDDKRKIEDHYSSLLIDLDIVKNFENHGADGTDWYKIESGERESLPLEILFYSILDNEEYGNSISLHKLLNGHNSPGNIFALNPDALVSKIIQLTKNFYGIVYKEDAGIRELQINSEFNKIEVLNNYYA